MPNLAFPPPQTSSAPASFRREALDPTAAMSQRRLSFMAFSEPTAPVPVPVAVAAEPYGAPRRAAVQDLASPTLTPRPNPASRKPSFMPRKDSGPGAGGPPGEGQRVPGATSGALPGTGDSDLETVRPDLRQFPHWHQAASAVPDGCVRAQQPSPPSRADG
ncbi:MAG: hypothetical protein LBQ12_12690 [Deltaproteobacteria bacterium]|nr:hypothetical protein [Deltaproteobacteria bacterium]